ncbi:MAG: indolepyruvate ferredoxin oxidoreductase family protein [Chloroflexi bacterium]|nr:indolepyruvate ferredoxin oxidoreductase family protein [Chloroflexota bacterium]
MVTAAATRQVTLDDKYLLEEGRTYLSGVQALVRLPLDQARRDRRAGLKTGTFISGYEGSPLGGYDLALARIKKLLKEYNIVHVPGVNEDLAATAVEGAQYFNLFPNPKVDGILSIWYGKSPGVDRSGDALKHANYYGTGLNSAALLLGGDDPSCKSSTLPSGSEYAYYSFGMPILYPSSVQEFLEYGMHAVAISRMSGCWVALKLLTNLCDGGQTMEVGPDRPRIVLPPLEVNGKPFKKLALGRRGATDRFEVERHLFQERLPLVEAYARVNGLSRVVAQTPHDRLGIITAGKTHTDLMQAFRDVGLDIGDLNRLGVRILCLGMMFPIDREAVRDFARGLRKLMVVEEKRPFLETLVKDVLYGVVDAPQVIGKLDERGQPLTPVQGEMDQDMVLEAVGPRLLELGEAPAIKRRLEELRAIRSRSYPILPMRGPALCSGCPHNTSTVLPEGTMMATGIGCHAMTSRMATGNRVAAPFMVQMGGEGAMWIGASQFTEMPHLFQNLGDGTLFHSGYLAVRFAVSAGVNITYKVLYNGHVSMTGGQRPAGQMSVPDLARALLAEGVKKVVILAEKPEAYRGVRLPVGVPLYHRDRIVQVQDELKAIKGVTALIYDQECAAEKRRKRKRGLLEDPNVFLAINEEVCEGCGDCGEKSGCVSLYPIETEFGRKTMIHHPSCNKDYTCIKGDCPSFLTIVVKSGTGLKPKAPPPELPADAVAEPAKKVSAEKGYSLYAIGIGGTGVVTINALLCYAALMEGKHVQNLDQTGVAQKGGGVYAHVVMADRPFEGANKVSLGRADLYLGLDSLGAASRGGLEQADPGRTVAVVNATETPTGEIVRDVTQLFPAQSVIRDTVNRYTKQDQNIFVEGGQIAEALFADHMVTNLFMLGVAYQAGLVPLKAESIEKAIELNAAAVKANTQAFRYGRLYVHDPERLAVMTLPQRLDAAGERDKAYERLAQRSRKLAEGYRELLNRCAHLDEESRRMLSVRVAELIEYQDLEYAKTYVDLVLQVARREQEVTPGREGLTQAVIRYLYKLMAYKDEYEVARLHLRRAREYAGKFEAPEKLFYNLHPPMLKKLSKNKIRVGTWFDTAFHTLVAMRRLRGTRFDPFGYQPSRREERELMAWYCGAMSEVLTRVRPETYEVALKVLKSPEDIRGYEQVKHRNAVRVRQQAERWLDQLRKAAEPTAVPS